MNNSEKIDLIERILTTQEEAEEYSKALPNDVRMFIVDNPINIAVERINSMLLVPALGERLADELNYFMWDMPKSGGRVIVNDVEYRFNNKEEFLVYLRKVYKDVD